MMKRSSRYSRLNGRTGDTLIKLASGRFQAAVNSNGDSWSCKSPIDFSPPWGCCPIPIQLIYGLLGEPSAHTCALGSTGIMMYVILCGLILRRLVGTVNQHFEKDGPRTPLHSCCMWCLLIITALRILITHWSRKSTDIEPNKAFTIII